MNTSKSILVIGESGVGKSTSMRNLNPKTTMIFSSLGKGLPFKNSRVNYTVWNRETNPSGNVVISSSARAVAQWLRHISDKMPEIKTICLDDSTFYSIKELDRRREESGYTKYSDIAHDFLNLAEIANTLREDLNVYFLFHAISEGDGVIEEKVKRAMSSGKMIQEKLASVEAQFEIVLLACKMQDSENNIVYKFKTRDMASTAKSPMGLFEQEYIDNDLDLVNKAIQCYYNDDCEEIPVKAENNKKTK